MPLFSPRASLIALPRNANVLNGMVVVHFQVAAGGNVEIAQAMHPKKSQHMVEKRYLRIYLGGADAVKLQFHQYLGLFGLPVYFGSPGHLCHVFSSLIFRLYFCAPANSWHGP
jgi:hypothetical protein